MIALPKGSFAQAEEAAVDWDTLTVLDLTTAINVSLAENPGLDAAAARVRQATDRVAQARSAYWPRLDATASGARVKMSENSYQENLATARFFNPSATIDDPEEYYNADLTASWTLFDGFERKFSNLAARYAHQSSQASLADARRLLVAAVAQAYFAAQLALENIAIARADEAFNDRLLSDAEARQRVGTGALSDVLNFQVRKNQAKTSRINQEYQYAIARFGLAALMGLPASQLPEHVRLAPLAPETVAELATPQLDSLIAGAADRRADIQALHWGIRQADAQIDVARAGNYPSVAVSGGIQGERSGDPGFGRDDFGNQVQVGLSYNLFSGGLTNARISEARHRLTELEKQLEDRLLTTAADIRSAAAQVQTAQTQVTLQRENASLVQRTRDLVEKEYNAGQGSLVRLNEAQRDLTAAQGNLALALVSLRQAWIQLQTRAGTLLSEYVN
jgi:outer membrane protein